jgi:hypothetical protein
VAILILVKINFIGWLHSGIFPLLKAWLGWQPDSQTTLSPDDIYNELTVRINAVTGEYISRMAYFAVFIGEPGMTPPDITPWGPILINYHGHNSISI